MSRIVKGFFQNFKKSLLPQIPYYRTLLSVPMVQTLKYFIALIFFLNAIFFVILAVWANPVSSLKNIPEDLNTYDRPYFMWLDFDKRKILFLVADRFAVPSDIGKYNSYALLTSDSLVINQDKTGMNFQIPLNQELASNFATVIGSSMPVILVFLIFGAFLIIPIISAVYFLLIIAAASLISYLIYNLIDKRHDHSKTFQLALHASTLPIMVFYFLNLVVPTTPNLPLTTFILILIFTLCALYEAYLDKK